MPDGVGPGRPWKLMLLSLLLFFIAVSVYFGLVFGYKPMLTAQVAERKDELINLGEEISEADRESFLNFYSQFVNLKSILDNHVVSSRLFSFLEQNTHEGVYYTSVSLDIKNKALTLRGISKNFETISSQGKTMSDDGSVSQVIFDDIQNNDDGINFKMKLIFSNESFQ